ncbi:MAG: RNA 3'-phosphate cyclase [Nitrosopumilaceae archaeon]|nr:RNA 3'-phosphate cyclase [Nitrosopumilaceae archaeon]NIU00822.1 RNA 3'-phosphate cyclase [Nitrosopumilaceae archaeon]NIU87275.1 RNA 3'-phosphate cyclase [Nitrosopumilaceae archaeon]NIV65803.1 RNA 3'-phosphate cyclase [Nitrosopumilaceae archaeon]NIX61424.1 RNA 3'-phosphate cyclase [Nitrosopumilaceae archaeon]
METTVIDGEFGEGGGQIVRSALTYSVIKRQPIEIINIRKRRQKPGLRPQHVTAAMLLAKISNATLDGATIGSSKIKFNPNKVINSKLKEDVGTAGSISLILQVLVPAVAISKRSMHLTIRGGTDVGWSPTMDYIRFVLLEAYSRMGIQCSVKVKKRGYYPKGAGCIELSVMPSQKVEPIVLNHRKTTHAKITCSYSQINQDVIKQEVKKIEAKLKKDFTVSTEMIQEPAIDKGSAILIYSIDENSVIGVDCLFENGFKEKIADRFLNSRLGLDENLADMVVLPASLAQGQSVFTVPKITKHLETNLYVAEKITGCKYGVGKLSNGFEVRINEN